MTNRPAAGLVAALLLALGNPGTASPADPIEARVAAIAAIESAISPAPAPDGKGFAFVSDASGVPQVWVQQAAGARPVQLTDRADQVLAVHWSPDGSRLAYAVAPGGGYNLRIHVIRPDGTDDRLVPIPSGVNVRLFGWAPDGRLRIAIAAPDPAKFQSRLVDPLTGAFTDVGAPAGSLAFALVSADGRYAVLEKTVQRGDVRLSLVTLATGEEQLLTPHEGLALNSALGIAPDGSRLWIAQNAAQDRLALSLIEIDPFGKASPPRTLLVRADAELHAGTLSDDGRTLAIVWNAGGLSQLDWFDTKTLGLRKGPRLERSSPPVQVLYQARFAPGRARLFFTGTGAAAAQDIHAVDARSNRLVRLTRSGHAGVDLGALAVPTLVSYTARDGIELSGWLYRPPGATGPGPLVFHYHGGPESQARPFLDETNQALVASGISVFAPNVRGSYGYGKAFLALDNGPLRVNGVRDIEDSTNHLVRMGIADPARLGILGGSYGGYMVMAGVTEFPDMFAAGANLYGIVNFDTFFRHSEPWIAAVSATEYGDPATQADLLRSLSPIHKLGAVRTPLIVLHGANDTNVPVVEAEQIVAALQARQVPVRYILFPDEGHGWRKRANRVRSTAEITRFFTERLAGTRATADTPAR